MNDMHVPDNRDSDVGKQYSTESNEDAIRGMMMGITESAFWRHSLPRRYVID